MKKYFYRIRRNAARFIVGLDNCPIDCRINYSNRANEIITSIAFGIAAMASLLVVAILAL